MTSWKFMSALVILVVLIPATEFFKSAAQKAEAPAVAVQELTSDDRNDDCPSLAVADDKKAWLVWQSYSGQNDEIRLRQYEGNWRTFTRLPGTSRDVWRPRLALQNGVGPWVVWSQQVNGNFDIYARGYDEGKNLWLELTRLSSHPFPDIYASVAADPSGRLYVVWQGFHGNNSDIFLRYYDGKSWSAEMPVTTSPANDWEPSVAVGRRGQVHIVWDTYRNGNYDVYMRTFDGGRFGPEIAVTRTPGFEAHASVAVDASDRVWVAWDETGTDWGKDCGLTDDPHWLERGQETWRAWQLKAASAGTNIYSTRRLNLVVFDGEQRKAPLQDLTSQLEPQGILNADHPQLIASPHSGRVALLFHRWTQTGQWGTMEARPTVRWEQAVTFYEGSAWSPVVTLPDSRSRISARGDAAFSPDGALWVTWPTDGRTTAAPYQPVADNVYFARLPGAQSSSAINLGAYQEPATPPGSAVHGQEPDDVAAIRAYRASVKGVEYRVLRGDLHRHTELSWDNGGLRDGSLFDAYRYMLDAASLDFGSVTDHNGGGDYEYWWWITEKSSDMFFIPGTFLPLYGYERSVQYPSGHRNVFHIHRGVPVVSYFTKPAFDRPRPEIASFTPQLVANDTKLLWSSLHETNGISIPHTTGSFAGVDWKEADALVEPVVELYQGARVSYEHPGAPRALRSFEDFWDYRESGFVWNAWRKGLHLGVIASSDHWSTHISYAMVFAEKPTRESVFNGIKSRHTYGATDNIVLDFQMGDHLMGDEFTADQVPPLRIRVIGTSPIVRLDIIRDEKLIHSLNCGKREVDLTFRDPGVTPGSHYYYVRVIQDDWEMAWSSPIWITYRKP
jgi:hypothetical protein